ncbi:MAG: ferrochelatase [Candidatus Delongbacteria bacterium]|nr:ferrochelatase [Candidatus Delongbacteria bacterium]
MPKRDRKQALLLVNMGGPAVESDIKPYLQQIFQDRAILPVPRCLRSLLSRLIIHRRLPLVKERYRMLGGGSPLLQLTGEQAQQIEQQLGREDSTFQHVTYAFRYTAPTLEEALTGLTDAGFNRVLLLPLFPHYTSAMSGSIEVEPARVAAELNLELILLPPWGADPRILELQESYLQAALTATGNSARVLFVAHGIPMRNLRQGDPYVRQVSATAHALGSRLPEGVDWSLAYQSRLGPIKWTGPYLQAEIERLAVTAQPLIIMPLSFVADCLETLYDLDMIAASQGLQAGISQVLRVPVFNSDPAFCRLLLQIASEVEHVQ